MDLSNAVRRWPLLGAKLRSGELDERRVKEYLGRRFAGNLDTYVGGVASGGQNANRGRSPLVWQGFQQPVIREDSNLGSFVEEEFQNWGGLAAVSNVSYYGGYKSYEVTSGSIKQLNTVGPDTTNGVHGAISLLTVSGTANANVALEAGGGNGGSWMITSAALPKLYYEVRMRTQNSGAALTGYDFFVGLTEKGLAVVSGAATLLTTADAVGSKSLIGFWMLTAAQQVNFGYRKNGQALKSNPNGTAGTLVAQTWTKLGFRFDPNDAAGYTLRFFQDGVQLGYETAVNVAAATFPSAAVLTPTFALQNDATGTLANTLDLDWYRVGSQLVP